MTALNEVGDTETIVITSTVLSVHDKLDQALKASPDAALGTELLYHEVIWCLPACCYAVVKVETQTVEDEPCCPPGSAVPCFCWPGDAS